MLFDISAKCRTLLPVVMVAGMACSQPDYAGIKREFEKTHPGCIVHEVAPGEGDSDTVYVQVSYTCGGSAVPATVEEMYQRNGRKWRLILPPTLQNAPRMAEQSRPIMPLRVGGDVKAPVLIEKIEPVYPSKNRRVAAIIILEGVVTKSGDVRDLHVIKGAGDPWAPAVVKAVLRWRFRPATKNGVPVDVIYNVTAHIDVR